MTVKKPMACSRSAGGQRLDPGFELLAGHVGGIEIGAQRLALGHAGDEGGVIVEIAPRAFVEPEIVQALLAQRRGVLLQFGVQLAIAAPELVHEEVVEHARGFDQFGQRLAVAGGERGGIVLRGHGRETRAHLFQLIQIGHNGSGGQQHEKVLHLVYCGTTLADGRRPRSSAMPSDFAVLAQGDAQLFERLVGDGGRGVAHQVGAARGLGERDHFADGSLARQDHHQAVEPERDAAVRRRAVFQRVQQEAEAAARFFVAEAERGEDLRLHVAAMNTDRARAQLVPFSTRS